MSSMKTILSALAAALALALPAHAQVADWRTPDPQDVLVIDTSKGRVVVEMAPRLAPAHVDRIRTLARGGFYDGLKFFRVIGDFMAQTGDPLNNGTGASDLPDLGPEFEFRRNAGLAFAKVADIAPTMDVSSATEIGFAGAVPVRTGPAMQMMVTADQSTFGWGLFCPGVAGMARAEPPDSANSQFFLMRQHRDSLNRRYTVWGRVISGLDVVRAIKTGEPVEEPMDAMTKVRILADMPAAERPAVQVMDTRGPAFAKALAEAREKAGAAFSICDVDIPARIG